MPDQTNQTNQTDPTPTNVIAHGVDLVEVARVSEIRARHPDRFLTRVFTEAERTYALQAKHPDQRLAARFAAKEAVMKALGTGHADGIRWHDVEVTRDNAGRPGIHLTARAKQIAEAQGITTWLLSLTHTRTTALASVLALK